MSHSDEPLVVQDSGTKVSNVEEPVSSFGVALYVLAGSVGYIIHGPRVCAIFLGSAALIRILIAQFTRGAV